MARPRIYIDGQQGTTGLRIREMLASRDEVEVLLIPAEERKNPRARAEYLNQADVAILCLPDDAAGEAVALVQSPRTRIIDTSTARRVDPAWVYGLPELSPEQRQAIRDGRRVANTGCYPVGFTLAVRPLIAAGLLDPEVQLTVNAVSGFSGGGRKMVEAYEDPTAGRVPLRLYSLGKVHKHVAEMHAFSLTRRPPLFVPSVNDAFCGMLVSTPVPAAHLPADAVERISAIWRDYYRDSPMVRVGPPEDESDLWPTGTWIDQSSRNLGNQVDLCAFGIPGQGVVLVGRLDNLGKGASGNAVQCLNLMLGFPETAGLL
ncbi:MAG: N-acetyl-gamma-glutamyl-phosphate reductase [Candidatus Latescibacterota bacterium]